MRIIYIAGPYIGTATHDASSYEVIKLNIQNARNAGIRIIRMGAYPWIPHQNTAHFELSTPEIEPEFYYEACCEVIKRRVFDALFVLPGVSEGVRREVEVALACGIPVYEHYEDLERFIKGDENETGTARVHSYVKSCYRNFSPGTGA